MNEAFAAIRNVAETNTENTTTAKSLKLVLVEKMEKLSGQGAHSAWRNGISPDTPSPQVPLGPLGAVRTELYTFLTPQREFSSPGRLRLPSP